MNKIFKVVWSKSKECYVVVSEVAKNNGGKKKVLASILAGLAMVGVAAQMVHLYKRGRIMLELQLICGAIKNLMDLIILQI